VPLHLLPIWVQLRCGGCAGSFTGNARSVPQWKDVPACPTCWQRINDLRVRVGMPPWDTPVDAYPEEEEAWLRSTTT
jgi:hypothetical protein